MADRSCEWCGKPLDGRRSNARFCDSTCRANATRWRQGRSGDGEKTLQTAATPPIQAVREEQEAETERWATVVDEAIRLYFREHPGQPFHADDLEHLGVPDHYRKSVVGSQIAKWVNRRWMTECGRRKSAIPSRNGAKSNEYRLTEKGQKEVARNGADGYGDAREDGGLSCLSPSSLSAVSGDRRAEAPDCGPVKEGRLFDLDEAAQRPLNPLADREAA